MLAQLRKRIYQRLWDRVPQGEIAPKWLMAARFVLLPITTVKFLVMDEYYDIMTDTWRINGVRMSGRMIAVMTAEIDKGRWHRFVRQGDLVIVESVMPDTRLKIVAPEASIRVSEQTEN